MVDDKDRRILEVLLKDADFTTRKIAKVTRLPITTVHNRIKKLKKQGVIKGYTLRLDHEKLGLPLAAYILVNASLMELKEAKLTQSWLAKKLRAIPFVEEVSVVTGTADLMLKVRVASIKEFNSVLMEQIQSLDGIKNTTTLMVLEEL
ncbi:MAG: Lrp/AsnC family transcriptional regulator [Nanoarchaeota archaeon]|nr:Lrp/AsnC family transcriptional regulator [Nanoarchaeota archaeon]